LKLSGNPVRINLKLTDKAEAVKSFGLNPSKKVLLVIGGSGGAHSINQAVAANLDKMIESRNSSYLANRPILLYAL